jgi:MFS transporter, DHA3 family, tetracycline resistance protein
MKDTSFTYRLYLWMEGTAAFFIQLPLTILVVFYTSVVGLQPLQLVLVGTVFEVTIFLFEIPTGVIADTYSRRLSVLFGFLLFGVGLLVQGLIPQFGVLLIGEIIAGIGVTFTSGALQAWITDEIGEACAAQAFMRGAQIKLLCSILGIVVSVILAAVDLRWPFIAAGIGYIAMTGFLTVTMPETGFQRTAHEDRQTWRGLLQTARTGLSLLSRRHILFVIIGVQFIVALHSEGFDALWQLHFLEDFTLPGLGSLPPVAWFGIFGLGASAAGIIVNEIVRRRVFAEQDNTPVSIVRGLYDLMTVAILIFGLTTSVWLAMMAYWLVIGLRAAAEPVMLSWLNQHVEPSVRATMFSFTSQTGAFGEILGGPPLGAVAARFSVRAALVAAGLILATILPLMSRQREQTGQASQQALVR